MTCVDPDGDLVARFQTHGLLTELSEDAILLRRDDGSIFGLPPAPEFLDPAQAGVYTLDETGDSVEDPDFLATLTVTVNDEASLGELRAHGFRPPAPE